MPMLCIGGMTVRRYQDRLYLVRAIKKPNLKTLILPNLRVPEGAHVDVRFRVGGEKLVLHGQTKSLKSLFQTWGVPPWLRDTIPLILIDDVLAVVLDFAIADDYYKAQRTGLYSITVSEQERGYDTV